MIAAWVAALAVVAGVLVLSQWLGVLRRSAEVLRLAQGALMAMGDRALDDDEKEKLLQRQAVRLFQLFLLLAVTGAVALGGPVGLVVLADRLGWVAADAVVAVSLSAPFLGLMLVGTVLGVLAARRWHRAKGGAASPGHFENRYSTADQWLHYVAFASTPVQVVLSHVEDRLYRRRLARVTAERPVFIAALPRAGTTLLLNLTADLGDFATHTYRQMPMVITPLLWDRFSRRFRVQEQARERAHGDGLTVSADSPEALEEMLWGAFWPQHYRKDRIVPWRVGEPDEGFTAFFRQHMRKLAHLQPAAGGAPIRYLSKNNLNIARIAWLTKALPDATVLMPFRPPLEHASSLLRQHLNFLDIHASDPFARHYMAGVGHFDFGQNLRPIDFDGWLGSPPPEAPTTLGYWLRYWIASYRHLLRHEGDRVWLIDYQQLCARPEVELTQLAEVLQLRAPASLIAQADQIRARGRLAEVPAGLNPDVLREAESIFADLAARAADRRKIPA